MSNNFVTLAQTLASAVATSGTITVTYPGDTNESDFTTYDWFIVTESNDVYSSQAGDFDLTLGDTAATITWRSATTLAAGVSITTQLNMKGTGDLEAKSSKMDSVTVLKRVKPYHMVRVLMGNPSAADPNGILVSASATNSATSYDKDDFAAAYDDTYGLDVPRNVTMVGTAGSNHVVTVTGTDEYGDVVIEALTLSGTTAIIGNKAFKTIVTVAVAAGAASDTFDMGWGDKLGLPVFTKLWNQIAAQYVDGVQVATNEKVRLDFSVPIVAANAGTSQFVTSPVAGFVSKLSTVIDAAFTTGGAVTIEIETVAVSGLSATLTTGSAGTVVTDTPTAEFGATGEVAKDGDIEIVSAAALDSVGSYSGYIEVTPGGTFVAGDETLPTATTGDVRGTLQPNAANVANGSRVFEIDVLVYDPYYLGKDNYNG